MREIVRKNKFYLFLFFFPLLGNVWLSPYTDYEFKCGKKGGYLVLPTTSDPKSFNPIIAKETSTTFVTGFIFEGLTRTDPRTMKVVPNLAYKWYTNDGLTWIFKLRKDVYWNDGHKFTADDVVFTFNDLIYNPDIPSSSRDIFLIEGKPIKVEKVDDYTVKFILPSIFSPFLRFLSQEILPKHKYEKMVKEGRFRFGLGLGTSPKDIVGTGPFKLYKYYPGEKIILKSNPYYWRRDTCGKKLPYIDEIIIVILPNSDTALLKFIDKELDFYSLRPLDLSMLGPRRQKDNFKIYNLGLTFSSQFIVFNQNPGDNPYTKKPYVSSYKRRWFSNKLFRQAVSYAINRERISKIVYNGLAKPRYSPVSEANKLYFNPNVKKYPYSPQKAKDILTKIGFYDSDNDGYLEDNDGHILEINFYTNANDSIRVEVANLIKDDLEKVGFKINFVALDFNNLVNKLVFSKDWEMILIGLTGGIEPYGGKNVWSYKGQLHMWNLSGKPIAEYEKEIDEIFQNSIKELSYEKRRELFFRWQEIVADKLPLIYTVTPYSIFAIRDRFGNVYPTILETFSPEHIYVK